MVRGTGQEERSMASWKRRLKVYQDELIKCMEENQDMNSLESGGTGRKLQIITNRFISETHACMDKLNEEEGLEYTQLQLKAELLLASTPPLVPSSVNQQPQLIQSKLPKLELPKFTGSVLKWKEFWDRFHASVHTQNLCNADKLSYLQASLEGEALDTIRGLDGTNDNYPIAIDLLKDRYGKPGIVLDAHYVALSEITRASSVPKDCLDKFNDVERHLRVLKAMGEDINHNHLRSLIMSKFPKQLIQELRTMMKVEEENVESIRKQLQHLIMAKMPTTEVQPPSFTVETLHTRERKQPIRRKEWIRKRKISDTKGERSLTAPEKIRKINPCIFCQGFHFNDQCPKPVKDRRLLLKDRCYRCFSKGHPAKNCKRIKACYHCKSIQHNSAICPKPRRGTKFQTDKQVSDKQETTSLHVRNNVSSTTILQTAIIELHGTRNNRKVKCRALFDTGSQRSYITSKTAERLELPIIEQNRLTVYTFGSSQPNEIQSPCTEVEIKGVQVKINIIPYITEDVENLDPAWIRTVPPNVKKMADDGSLGKTIDILIGNDYYHTFIYDRKYKLQERLYLVDSAFGWIWSGAAKGETDKEELLVLTYFQGEPLQASDTQLDQPLQHAALHKLWDLETIGISDCPKATRDDQAVEQYNKTTKFHDGRYWVQWPWSRQSSELPENLGLAYGRLLALLKRIDQDTLKRYAAVLQEQIEKGAIEIANEDIPVAHRVHYLPHHHVIKDGKLRIVYDASSKSKGQCSLNECLYRGPLLLENLIGMIIRFRGHKYGILADVEKAFLQIGLQEADRDVTRFLWIKDLNKEPSKDNLLHLRFTRVPFGIGCSPFLLAITLKHHLQTVDSPLCKRIAQDIYVDNLVSGGDSTEECVQLYKETKQAFESISMKMRDWYTNNSCLSKAIDDNLLGKQAETVPVLGINWVPDKDVLSLKINQEMKLSPDPITKRKILSQISSIFDPCGFITPLLIKPKLFLQNLWLTKVDWDTSISVELQSEWKDISHQLKELKEVEIPRWYGVEKPITCELELHGFVDASLNAYTAAIYMKVCSIGNVKVNLIISKSRLTPIKNRPSHTIPRLELLAVLIGCRLIKFVKTHLPTNMTIAKTFVWTDSQIVLQWIKSHRILPPFVTTRIAEIRKSKEIEFKFVPTHLNPADIATRPCQNLALQRQWFEGPLFLYEDKIHWPKGQTAEHCILSRVEELQVIKDLQKLHFPDETSGKVTNLSRSLGLFDENGILRCKGRFKFADWPVDQKFPVLLPKNTDYTNDIIESTHRDLYHVGVSQTLAAIRQKFWIPHGRSQVQKVLRRCKECKKYGGGPYRLPPVAPLPEERLDTLAKPFVNCGIDYLGPLYISSSEGLLKRWICLITCLSIRAVHLEVVNDLTAEECTLAIRRFAATRGIPEKFLSDNATNFTLTAKIMEETGVEWRFIPELAPWFGGVYERLVGLVKHCLRRTIDKRLLNHSQLTTVIKEIESVINQRPLTTVGADIETILTPSVFLRAGGPLLPSEKELESGSEAKKCLIEGWKKGKKILEDFTKMFKNQYLASLRERNTNLKQKRITHNRQPKIGDIVQIKDDCPRVKWETGKISELIGSKDEEIRVAVVDLTGGRKMRRSISHLYPLEMDIEENVDETLETEAEPEETRPENEDVHETEKAVERNNLENRETESNEKERTEEGTKKERRAAREARQKMSDWLKVLFVK